MQDAPRAPSRKVLWPLAIAIALLGVVAALLFTPTPVRPVVWTPSPNPGLTGDFALNDRLAGAERLFEGVGVGPEDIVIDGEGRIYTGYADGRIMQLTPAPGSDVPPEITELGNTGGRPLGIGLLPDGGIAIADAVRGLLRLNADRSIDVLSVTANGRAMRFVDDLAVDGAGNIYFSDASSKYGIDQVMLGALEHGGHGRLLRYNAADGSTDVLLSDLQFANGVALGPDEQYVLVNETFEYRVTRLWLRGPKAGQSDVFIEGLPGFPDNINYDPVLRRFWLALYAPRDSTLDKTADKPGLRKIIARLPAWLHPKPVKHGIVLGLDLEGNVVTNLQDASDTAYGPITSAVSGFEHLYMGSLSADAIARIPMRDALY